MQPARFGQQAIALGFVAVADQVKPQNSINLLADIPEFHPPGKGASGYHYVGPLLDRQEEPAQVEILDRGWDQTLPLIYVTCGSSGAPPDYLDGLVEAIQERPYRLLITTAGRWSPRTDHHVSGNVRVVDFLPGEWVLKRADLLVGVVGIGAIYQALRNGVPIIGAPEHLDQEYHLNRVASLGLGLKLDRQDFDAERILAAVDAVMADVDSYRARCRPFVDALAAFPDGTRVADLLDGFFCSREEKYHLHDGFLISAAEFARFLDATTPPSLNPEAIRALLSRSVGKGIPHRWQGKQLYFDYVDSWNWLYDNDPSFFESDYRALETRRRRFFEVNGRVRSHSRRQRYLASYRLRLFPEGSPEHLRLESGQRIRVFLPYPIARAPEQQDVELVSCAPAEMKHVFAPSLGFFYGFETEIGDPAETLEFSYECKATVCELNSGDASCRTGLTDSERRKFLELDSTIAGLPEVVQFRQRLGLSPDATDEERARAIYDVLVSEKRFKKTKDHTQNPKYSTAAVLSDTGGHCRTLSRAFASLCRAEGIPTREVTGALIG